MYSNNYLTETEFETLVNKLSKEHENFANKAWYINTALRFGTFPSLQDLYIGGNIFGKIDKKGKLSIILENEEPKLPNSDESFFYALFDGQIYSIEATCEYPLLMTFHSNASNELSVYYDPKENQFLLAPRRIKKAYKLTPQNTINEIKLPEWATEDTNRELLTDWCNRYKIFTEKDF